MCEGEGVRSTLHDPLPRLSLSSSLVLHPFVLYLLRGWVVLWSYRHEKVIIPENELRMRVGYGMVSVSVCEVYNLVHAALEMSQVV